MTTGLHSPAHGPTLASVGQEANSIGITLAVMEMRRLGNTDLTVSRACFGTMTFGLQSDQAAATRLIEICLDRGVNFFDTANVYSTGVSETMLGAALKGRRDRAIVASKVRMRMGGGPDESGLARAAIFKAIDESLARLETDYLDI